LTVREREEVREFIVKQVAGRVPLVLGIGGNNTDLVAAEVSVVDTNGIDYILSISPYYTKPNQRGIYEHFAAVAESSRLPIILYNVPGRTSRNIEPSTIIRLANDFQNIVAVKEASGNMSQIMSIMENKPDDFMVISGDDSLTVPLMSVGVSGVISVAANVAPAQCVKMVNAAAKGDFKEASRIHYQLLDLMGALFEDGSPAGAKAALNMLGIINSEYLRLPLVPVCDATREHIKAALAKI
jgi:4-hydroxy-tetrahydrodipicolinate synthase